MIWQIKGFSVSSPSIACSVGNSHRSASPRPTTLEEDRELFVNFSLILCWWFEIQDLRTYNFFDWISNTDCLQTGHWVRVDHHIMMDWVHVLVIVQCQTDGCSLSCKDGAVVWQSFGQLAAGWGRVTHICVGNQTIIGSDNGLSPGRRQAIIWTNAGILLIGPQGTNFNEILIEIPSFSFKKMRLKVPSAKWRPFYLGLNVLKWITNSVTKGSNHINIAINLTVHP